MSGSRLAILLRRLRRRERAARSARYASVAMLLCGAAAPWVWIVSDSAAAMATIAVSVLVAALAIAWVRTASLRSIAAAVDRSARLEDRVITALQHVGDEDLFSQLVVRDAERRLSPIAPASVFPFALPRATLPLAVAAAIVAAAGFAVQMRGGSESPGSTRRAEATEGEGGAAVDGRQDAGASARPGAGAGGSTRRAAPIAERRAESSATPADAAGSAGAQAARAAGEKDAADAATTPIDGAAPPRMGGGAARRGALNARGSGVTSSADAALGGGVDGASTPADSPHIVRHGRAQGAAPYATAANRAEAAIGRSGIPPGLGAYVRAYFAAIRQ